MGSPYFPTIAKIWQKYEYLKNIGIRWRFIGEIFYSNFLKLGENKRRYFIPIFSNWDKNKKKYFIPIF